MAIGTAIVTALVGAAVSAGMAAATAPDYPNPARSSRRVVNTDIQTLPGRRQVEAAARLGQAVDYATGRTRYTRTRERMTIKEAHDRGLISDFDYQKRRAAHGDSRIIKVRVRTPVQETRHADFTGFGDAEVQGRLAQQMARNQADLERKYGARFAEIAREQQKLADPEGTAAREMLASEINRMEDERQNAQRPVADKLDAQILQELESGKAATPDVQAAIAQVLARRGGEGSGGTVTAGDVEAEGEVGERGQARLDDRMRRSMGYLSSGATPEDVDYRRRQQSMANMAAFLRGQTPEAQFRSLAGGQQGATPIARGGALPQTNPNALAIGQNAAVQQANLGAQNAGNQAGGWMAGLAALTRGVQAYGAGRG